jgi:uncharacterized repeat protein (TIGR03803 family)
MKKLLLSSALCCVLSLLASAQTFTTLHSFSETDGGNPYAGLIQGLDGNFYGTTSQLDSGSYGTVFKITPAGALTTLYNFCSQPNCIDGAFPQAGLVQDVNGNLYGTTVRGGLSYDGVVFRITPAGTFTTLYSFCSQSSCADGSLPTTGLVQANNGSLYGTTLEGGSHNSGTIFQITPAGMFIHLYSFCTATNCADGGYPGELIQATNGNLYGTTSTSGAGGQGTIFQLTPGGAFTTLYSFCSQPNCTDGADPLGGLVQAVDGTLYGTTTSGGSFGYGVVYSVSTAGVYSVLHNFSGGDHDGLDPNGHLIQAANGNFYGTTIQGGVGNYGTIYQLTPTGSLSVLHSFDSTGQNPWAPLLEATNGTLYGTTTYGGNSSCNQGCGTVFSLSRHFPPFIAVRPTSGMTGARVAILGNDLASATSVSFNGAAATFTIISGTQIRTTVPAGATTGTVQVVTARGTLTSNVAFTVNP